MYSPQQKTSKEMQRQLIKEQKKQQLAVLLVNKFRNKFGVGGIKEADIDKIIKDEIQILLNKGSTCEADLNALDKKLDGLIKKMREDKLAKSTNKLSEHQINKLNNSGSLGRGSNGFDAKSLAKSI